MFSREFLHVIRNYEVDAVSRFLDPDAVILEVGGGTGYQVRKFLDLGFKMTSIC